MPQTLLLLEYAVAASFFVLGAIAVVQWLRSRERSRGYLAMALGSLGLVALLGRLQDFPWFRNPLVSDLDIALFLASGYGLLLFRSSFIPLSRRVKTVIVGLLVVIGLAAIVALPPGTATPTPAQTALILVFIGIWSACVGEPIVRFWLAARGRPAVQKSRLRALSLGFAGLILILVVSAGAGSLVRNVTAQVAIQVAALATVPFLYASFSPPGWLRREWRAPEEDAFREAIQSLLLFSPDRHTLAERAVDWAIRLVGGDGALIADADGTVLATQGVSPEMAGRVTRQLGSMSANQLVALQGEPAQSAVVVSLPMEKGPGALVVLSGPFTPVFGSDELRRVEGYASAITAGLDRTTLTERIAALEQTKSQFLNLASHELRGPITVIRGYLSMLEKGTLGKLTPQAQAVLPALSAKAEEMNLLVEQMLEAARLEEGRLELRPQRADLRELATHAVELMRPLSGGQHALILESPESEVPVVVDRDRIGTILNNLLENAMKYSPSGGEVRCTVIRDKEVGKVKVTDTGVGIAPSDMPQLFTRFGRVVTKETSHIPGTGLGLWLSRELARMHGGDITVVSRPGKGSTFTLAVPLQHG